VNRRVFVKRTAAAFAVAGAGCVAYAIGVEPHWLEIVQRDLPIGNLPRVLDGARLAQVSDLHIGTDVSDEYIIRSFDRLRALAPDIVVVTGDFLTHRIDRGDEQFQQIGAVMSHLPHGRLGTFGILGNHDYGFGWRQPEVADKVVAAVEHAGIRMLRNETQSVSGLDIIGVDDMWAERGDTAKAFSGRANAAGIVLVHNPDAADLYRWPEYRGWMLAGHTHGGQCKAPFLPPPLVPVQNPRYVSGEVAVDANRSLYISRGVGHLIRARFNARPEITVFTLGAAERRT
jgi:predicted MPP superfamily phosphohydrolase